MALGHIPVVLGNCAVEAPRLKTKQRRHREQHGDERRRETSSDVAEVGLSGIAALRGGFLLLKGLMLIHASDADVEKRLKNKPSQLIEVLQITCKIKSRHRGTVERPINLTLRQILTFELCLGPSTSNTAHIQ